MYMILYLCINFVKVLFRSGIVRRGLDSLNCLVLVLMSSPVGGLGLDLHAGPDSEILRFIFRLVCESRAPDFGLVWITTKYVGYGVALYSSTVIYASSLAARACGCLVV